MLLLCVEFAVAIERFHQLLAVKAKTSHKISGGRSADFSLIGSSDGVRPRHPPTPPYVRFSAYGGWSMRFNYPLDPMVEDNLFHQFLVHRSLSEVSRSSPRSRRRQARRGSTASARCALGVATAVVAPL